MDAEIRFMQLVQKQTTRNNVELGKMMSSPGIRYKNKNYAFFHKEKVGFKLGKEFDIEAYNVSSWEYLSPFKTKPPLKAWYIIDYENEHVWDELADLAYDYIRVEVDASLLKQ